MGNSSARLLKKRNKKKSIELIQSIIDLFNNEDAILINFNRPDIERVLRICKSIKCGKFNMGTLSDFASFKYPYNIIKQKIELMKLNNINTSNSSYNNISNYIIEYIEMLDKYSLKIFEKYKSANRDSAIDSLLND